MFVALPAAVAGRRDADRARAPAPDRHLTAALREEIGLTPGFAPPPELQYTSWHFRRTFGGLHLQDVFRQLESDGLL